MQVDFRPEQEKQLSQISSRTGKDAAQVVKDAVGRTLQDQTRFVEAVPEGSGRCRSR